MDKLSSDIIKYIYLWLPSKTIFVCIRLCKSFNLDDELVWKTVISINYGIDFRRGTWKATAKIMASYSMINLNKKWILTGQTYKEMFDEILEYNQYGCTGKEWLDDWTTVDRTKLEHCSAIEEVEKNLNYNIKKRENHEYLINKEITLLYIVSQLIESNNILSLIDPVILFMCHSKFSSEELCDINKYYMNSECLTLSIIPVPYPTFLDN